MQNGLDLRALPRTYAPKGAGFADVVLAHVDGNFSRGKIDDREMPSVEQALEAFNLNGDCTLTRAEVLTYAKTQIQAEKRAYGVWHEQEMLLHTRCRAYDDCREWTAAAWQASVHEKAITSYNKLITKLEPSPALVEKP